MKMFQKSRISLVLGLLLVASLTMAMTLQPALTTAAATSSAVAWPGGRGVLKASGTWGGGTLTLTWCESESGTYVPIGTGVSLTADGTTGFEIGQGFVKSTLSGSTGATVAWGVDGTVRKP